MITEACLTAPPISLRIVGSGFPFELFVLIDLSFVLGFLGFAFTASGRDQEPPDVCLQTHGINVFY